MASKKSPLPNAKTFSQLLDELEELVGKLETGEIELEEAIDIYEAGKHLAAECHKKLAEAENRLRIIDQQGRDLEIPLELKADIELINE